ncbi:hypothetical protein A3K79_04645 [Candidatus Bathyarchaeota archaeon RBG_13_46_16b]|nr:MAG: hypothetical protein A3K79_04645 [Candidatus Bathyarchaeota archaeon RBG_13_46_16b]
MIPSIWPPTPNGFMRSQELTEAGFEYVTERERKQTATANSPMLHQQNPKAQNYPDDIHRDPFFLPATV